MPKQAVISLASAGIQMDLVVPQPNADRIGRQYVFAGPCIDQRRRQGWVPAPCDDRPLVYVSFGTAYTNRPDVYRLCVEELAATHVDQFTNAARLEAIGAGVQLRTEQLDGESLRAAIDAAASRTAQVHELRTDVRSFGDAAIAADTVERLCVQGQAGCLPRCAIRRRDLEGLALTTGRQGVGQSHRRRPDRPAH